MALGAPAPASTDAPVRLAQSSYCPLCRMFLFLEHPERFMHIITRTRLLQFGRVHADADRELREWARMVRRKQYRTPLEVKVDFPSASFVGPWRTVFNIHGNAYRLVVDMRYDLGRVYVRHVVTHQEYDRLIRRGLL
jgi:mRNA interferase HigB